MDSACFVEIFLVFIALLQLCFFIFFESKKK